MAIRTCCVCGEKNEKSRLFRFVWSNGPELDEAQVRDGRGAYCCREGKCLQNFRIRQKKWKRVFRLS